MTQSDVRVIEHDTLAAMGTTSADVLLLQITSPEVFHQAHIPGALLVTPGELVSGIPPAAGKLPDQARLTALFRRLGYTENDSRTIVVYDDEGGGWAGRMAWTLDVIGQRRWCYLNGGLHAWAGAGQPLANGAPEDPAPSAVEINIDRGPIAEVEDVLASIGDPGQIVWDVRSQEEYQGLKQVAARTGHIPEAVNYDWLLLMDRHQHLRLNRAADTDLAELGLGPEQRIITHCQTHHRSGLSYMWGRLQGWDIRAYHGSWSEWGNREDTPIV